MNTNIDNNKINTFPSVRKVWISGTTLVISVPREVREATGLENKDMIKVIFTNEVHKAKDSKKKEKKTKEKKKEINTKSMFIDNEEESRLPSLFE